MLIELNKLQYIPAVSKTKNEFVNYIQISITAKTMKTNRKLI